MYSQLSVNRKHVKLNSKIKCANEGHNYLWQVYAFMLIWPFQHKLELNFQVNNTDPFWFNSSFLPYLFLNHFTQYCDTILIYFQVSLSSLFNPSLTFFFVRISFPNMDLILSFNFLKIPHDSQLLRREVKFPSKQLKNFNNLNLILLPGL